ncbi:MAG: carbamoyltransferase HypF, partial [Chloroflexi bacterium]|nr:carbamoyltransferase HypF [Chloroflexota bacterium]
DLAPTLAKLADFFLLHDRPIHIRCDDSVVELVDGKEVLIRRSRGYAPLPIRLEMQLEPVLACGAQLKNTFCLTRDNYAFLSQHIGDLENRETLDFFAESVDHMIRIFNLHPLVIAHDLHPDYLSTRYALHYSGDASESSSTPMARVAVQHHHAHIAACMAENGLDERVIGVAFDGTGHGPDGLGFERAARLRRVPLPGGEAAIRRPYRTAISYLLSAYGDDLPPLDFLARIEPHEEEVIRRQLARQVNSPLTSSCGRLFDAVSAILGIRREITYEGQAAIELEMVAEDGVQDAYRFAFLGGRPLEIDFTPMLRALVTDLQRGEMCGAISARFHNGVSRMISDVCGIIRRETGLNRVCLSGGVFQNRFLLGRTCSNLQGDGFEVYTHHLVPCNDGGVALGQAVVASEQVRGLIWR